MGVRPETYHTHENGGRGLARVGERYARFFRVNLEWLLTGRGQMRGRAAAGIPIAGLVGAGGTVTGPTDDGYVDPPDNIDLPDAADSVAYVVKGDSQYPRFLDGETLIAAREPQSPERMLGRLAICELDGDGEKVVKTIKRGRKAGLYTLASHNAPDMEDVRIRSAHAIKAIVLAR